MSKNMKANGLSRGTQYKLDDPGKIQVVKGFNARKKMTGIDELVDSILENGVRTPLWVRRDRGNPDQPFILIAGQRRLTALKKIWEEYEPDFKIPVNIFDVDEDEAELLMLAENMERENLTPIDEAAQVVKWLQKGLTPEEVVDRLAQVGLKRSIAWVEQRRVLAGASTALKRKVESDEVLLSVALDIARKTPTGKQAEVLDAVIQEAGGKKSKQRKAAAKVTGTAVRPGKKSLQSVMRAFNSTKVTGQVSAKDARKLAIQMLTYAAGEATKDEVLESFAESLKLDATPADPKESEEQAEA